MAEKQIPAISQVGGKVGIGLKKPEHPLQVSGTIHISADVNDDLLSWHGGGLRRESEQGGFVLGSDSSVMLHAGDNRVSVWGYDSLNDSSTGEILHLTSDNMVEIHTGLQTGGSSKWDVNRWRFLNSGSTEFPTSASVYNNGFVSGFIGGTGWQIRKTGDMTFAEFDNILVRNTLQTHIFQKDVVKATNGQLYVSDSGVIVATNGSSTVTFNSQSATFTDNTLLQYKDVNPDTGNIVSVKFRINDSSPSFDSDDNATYDVDDITGNLSDLVIGGTAVRISGGSLLLDASSPNSPFMDVLSGSSMVVRTGNLAGVTSDKFTNIGTSGFGFYASGSAFLEGSINADGGEIGGWTINNGTLTGGNVTLDSTGIIKVGNPGLSGIGDVASDNTGITINNNGEVLIKQGTSDFIRFDNGAISMSATTFKLDTDHLDINSDTKTISVGSSIAIVGTSNSNNGQITIGSNITLNGSGTSTITGDMEIAGWTIDSSVIQKTGSSSTDGIVIDSSNKVIQVHGASGTGVTANSRANARLLLGKVSTGKFGIKGFNDGGTRIFELSDNRTEIAGWSFTSTQIKTGSLANGGIVIQSSPSNNINIRTGSTSDTLRVSLGQESTDSSTYGLFGYDSGGSTKLFELSNTAQQIAGFEFTQNQIAKNNITMSNAGGGKITLNQGTTFLSGSGEGQFANGGIQFDKDGNVIITGSVTIGADVTVNADVSVGSLPNFPKHQDLIAHWNFNDFTSGSSVDSNNFILDNSGNNLNGAVLGTFKISDGVAGNAVLFQSESAGAIVWDYDELDSLNHESNFTMTVWVKRFHPNTGSADPINTVDQTVHPGVFTNGQPIFIKGSTSDSFGIDYRFDSNQVRCGMRSGSLTRQVNFTMDDDLLNFHHLAFTFESGSDTGIKLYVDGVNVGSTTSKGLDGLVFPNSHHIKMGGSSVIGGNGGPFNGFLDEPRVYSRTLSEGEVQSLFLYPDGPGGTRISGDTISTGVIKSNNLSTTIGSTLDLNEGTIKLGGTTSPKFAVDSSGNVSASSAHFDGTLDVDGTGRIAGWTIDRHSLEKVNSPTNFSSFFSSDASASISSENHGAEPVLSIFNSSNKFMVNVGNIYKNKTHNGIAVFSDYGNNTKIFEASEDGSNDLIAQIAGWDFDTGRLAKGNVTMSSADEQIKLGTVTDFSIDGTNTGILMDGTGKFFVGNEADDYIYFDGNNVEIKSNNLIITASDILMETDTFFLGSTNKFISGSGTNIEISSSGFHLKPEGDVVLSGSITANDGIVGGWNITTDKLASSNDEMEIIPTKGIIARNETSHSLQSFEGFFSFAIAHHSVGPGGGGQTFNTDGELLSQGGGGQYDDDEISN